MWIYSCHAFTGTLVVAVSDKVLSRSSYLIVVLHAFYHFDAQFGYEIGRFSIYLFIASPTLVTSYMEYGSVYIGVSQHACFPAGDESYLMDEFTVPGMS